MSQVAPRPSRELDARTAPPSFLRAPRETNLANTARKTPTVSTPYIISSSSFTANAVRTVSHDDTKALVPICPSRCIHSRRSNLASRADIRRPAQAHPETQKARFASDDSQNTHIRKPQSASCARARPREPVVRNRCGVSQNSASLFEKFPREFPFSKFKTRPRNTTRGTRLCVSNDDSRECVCARMHLLTFPNLEKTTLRAR